MSCARSSILSRRTFSAHFCWSLWGWARWLTKNVHLGYAVWLVLTALCCIVYVADATAFEGLLPKIMKTLSLFERLNTFVNGVFDLTALVYFLSVIVVFLFLTVQSLEKRWYN